MEKKLAATFDRLHLNERNYVVSYQNNKRIVKSWRNLSDDIDAYIRRFNILKGDSSSFKVGIIGPISYSWMVIDLACLKGGFLAVGIPEHLVLNEIEKILINENLDVLLIDYSLKEKFPVLIEKNNFYFDCFKPEDLDIAKIDLNNSLPVQINLLQEFGVAYTSGTSLNIKRIKLLFGESKKEDNLLQKIILFIKYKTSFWSRSDNKLILFMPFSHAQQRSFVKMALNLKINIVLSDPVNCIRHIILEKPNIMVSVPAVYELMANRIKSKVALFSHRKKKLFKVFNDLGINNTPDWNPVKKIFSHYLFRDIKKIYGGKANYFVVGSAKVSPEVIRSFHQAGVKLLEAYGQSETGIIANNTHKHFRVGSVGKPRMEVKIANDGEILVKVKEELHNANRGILNIDETGYILTGDVGYLDKDGFLFLQGRKDEVIVLESGKKVFPVLLEEKLKLIDSIHNAVVYSPNERSLRAILSVDKRTNQGQIKAFLQGFNSELAKYERVSEFLLDYELWDIKGGFLTNTMKVKRKVVIEKFKREEFISVNDLQLFPKES